ncbi:phage tail protein [Virgibacillus salexigens]|uniref:phage tail protein n=1 Tax=Virgibacillus TaxID=84406 RepID=UPI00136FCF30|nr:hypothetical protein [Virgibacillus massiliensis]
MYIRNLNGDEFALQATTTTDLELNGNQSLSLQLLPSKVNKLFIDEVAELWQITADGITYKIVYAKRKGEGRLLTVEVKAVPLFFDDFDTQRIYERYDQHMTAINCFSIIFENSGYEFVLVDQFEAIQWEGFGEGDTRLAMFKEAVNRYGVEFRIVGTTVYLERQIGRDTSFMYRHKLNASNIVQEIDAGAMYTYAKGYGDFAEGEEQNAKLIREYTSPLANIIGKREAPPIKNGKITTTSKMDESLKALVDESLQISVSADIFDLRKQGYELGQPELGDRTFLIDERIGLNEEVRIVNMSIKKDWKGNVLDLKLTFGSDGLTKRYQSRLNTAAKDITNILAGRKKMPFSVLPSAKQAAMRKLEEAQTELIFGNAENGVQGIVAQDKNDPNKLMWMNSNGWMISVDGGVTPKVAATAEGIVADVITTGLLNTDQVIIRGGDGLRYMYMNGSELISHGEFTRTWAGIQDTAELNLGIYNGRVMISNEDTGYNLYMTELGLSTTMSGAQEDYTAGTLEFHSQRFNQESRGVSLISSWGTVALLAQNSTIVSRSNLTNNIESEDYSVYIRPFMYTRTGLNEFQFYVKDNASASETDGALLYGNLTEGTTHGSGIRFSKKASNPTVYATNINGDIGTGNFHADRFLGHLAAPGDGFLYLMADDKVRITDRRGYNNGNPVLRDLQLSFIQANSIRVNDSDANLYIGTSSGEARVTNNLLYNNGDVGYRPIAASEFRNASSIVYKTNIEDLAVEGLPIINNLSVKEYVLQEDVDNGVYDNWQVGFISELSPEIATPDGKAINIYKLLGYAIKGMQEEYIARKELEKRVQDLEIIISEGA